MSTTNMDEAHRWTYGRKTYLLWDSKREVFIGPDDEVIDFRGDTDKVQMVSRGPEYNGTAKVLKASTGWECYANVFELHALPALEVGKTYQLDIYDRATMLRNLEMVRIHKITGMIVAIDLLDEDGNSDVFDLVNWTDIYIANEVGVHELIPTP